MNNEKEVIVIDKNLLIAIVKECQSRVEDVIGDDADRRTYVTENTLGFMQGRLEAYRTILNGNLSRNMSEDRIRLHGGEDF